VIEAETESDFNVGGASGGGGSSMDEIFFLKLIERTRQQMDKLVSTPGLEEIEVTSEIKVGRPSKLIFDEIDSGKFDMIVMGTKGISGLQEILVGSNAEKVVRRSQVPVLSVKELVEESTFKNIVFATSLKEDEVQVIEQIKQIQDAFGSKLHLVRINTPNNFQTDWLTHKQMETYAKQFKLENYTFNIFSDPIEEDGIILFAEEIDAGMIAMATHGRTGFQHLLSGSIAEDVVNHAKRPVLTINVSKQGEK
jgi:nucleotide-binding universal stress UspA family protein